MRRRRRRRWFLPTLTFNWTKTHYPQSWNGRQEALEIRLIALNGCRPHHHREWRVPLRKTSIHSEEQWQVYGPSYRVMKWNHFKLFQNYHILSLPHSLPRGGQRPRQDDGRTARPGKQSFIITGRYFLERLGYWKRKSSWVEQVFLMSAMVSQRGVTSFDFGLIIIMFEFNYTPFALRGVVSVSCWRINVFQWDTTYISFFNEYNSCLTVSAPGIK